MRSIAPRVSLADCFALGGMGTGDLTPPGFLPARASQSEREPPAKKNKQQSIRNIL